MEVDFFKWDNAFNTDIATIDTQHKVIIKILNELYNVVYIDKKEDKLDGIIYELVQYTVYHFGEEEKLFEKYSYIEEQDHIMEHRKFIERVKEFTEINSTDSSTLVFELIEFLKEWLIEHILVTDRKYVVFFEEKGIKL